MFSYHAYGLGIHSEIEISEFISIPTEPDVKITIDRTASLIDYLPSEAIEQPWAMHLSRESLLDDQREACEVDSPDSEKEAHFSLLSGLRLPLRPCSCRSLLLCSRCAAREERSRGKEVARATPRAGEKSFKQFLAACAEERRFALLTKDLRPAEVLPWLPLQ